MRFVFRTDASSSIGSGHVVRCLTLADELRRNGAEVLFVMREHPGHLGRIVQEHGFNIGQLPATNSSQLGADFETDVSETLYAIAGSNMTRPDWLVVDHYGIDERWERQLRPFVGKILAVDDLANRAHDCDVLLDQNLVANFRSRYDNLLPAGAIRLLGPRYALLQPSYAELAKGSREIAGPVPQLFVYFGANDAGLTLTSLQVLVSLEKAVNCDVVLGATSPDRAAVDELAAANPGIRVHGQMSSLAHVMARADLAIGAGGATSWERLCLGLRSIVVTLADNQDPIARELHRLGLVNWLGRAHEVDAASMRSAIENEIARGTGANVSGRMVDGRGTRRVAALLSPSTYPSVRSANAGDEELLLEWANDPVTRQSGFSPTQITTEAHHAWFSRRLVSPDWCRMYIAELAGGVEIGQVRCEKSDGDWYIHYSIAPEFRGRRLGAPMIKAAASEFYRTVGELPLKADVLEKNVASHKVFLSLGFEPRSHTGGSTQYMSKSPL